MTAEIEWTPYVWPEPHPARPEDIAAVEAALAVRFPEDYRAVVMKHQGMTPTPRRFAFGDGYSTVLNNLLHFDRSKADYNLLDAQGSLSWGDAPEGLVVFAHDPGGSKICFDFRASKTAPAVVILDHEVDPSEPTFVAESFTAFLALLR